MGSAYGGKHTGEHAVEAARLAKAAKQPVKLVWTREEEFTWAYFRPAGVIDIKSGVDADGPHRRVGVRQLELRQLRHPDAVRHRADQRIAFHASKSPLRQGSYRGLAATANHYAREMHMDEIARALGVDAVEFRLQHLKDERMRAVLNAAARSIGWPKPSARRARAGHRLRHRERRATSRRPPKSRVTAHGGFSVERVVIAFECGAIVNPDGLNNQVEGAVVQGLGGALFEAIEFADGHLRNGTMAQYRVPRFKTCRRSRRSCWIAATCRRPAPANRRWSPSPRRSARPCGASGRSTRRCRSGLLSSA